MPKNQGYLVEKDRKVQKTGLVQGGQLHLSADKSKLLVGNGSLSRVAFVDSLGENTITEDWTGSVEIDPSGLATGFWWLSMQLNADNRFLTLDESCWGFTTNDPKKDEITRMKKAVIGKFFWNADSGQVLFAENFANTSNNEGERADIIFEFLTPFIIEGCNISGANSTDLILESAVGKIARSGANQNYYGNESTETPDVANIPANSPVLFRCQTDLGSGFATQSLNDDVDIDGTFYDNSLPLKYNNAGVIANVASNRWAVYGFWTFTGVLEATGQNVVQMLTPTQVFKTKEEAWLYLLQNGFGELPANFVDAVLTTVIIAKGDLSNFTQTDKYKIYTGGITAMIGQGATQSTTLQKAIQNSGVREFTDLASVLSADPALASGEWFIMDSAVAGLGFTAKQLLQKP